MRNFLKKNENVVDRVVRIGIGIALLALTVVGPQTAWGLIGLIPLATGIAGWCPAYAILGLSTLKQSPKAANVSSTVSH